MRRMLIGSTYPLTVFPGEAEERERWISAIPYLTKEVYESYKCPPRVCAKHWPVGYEQVKNVNGKLRPRHPPSIFPTKSSSIPTAPPKPRPTEMTSSAARSVKPDQLPEFSLADKLTYEKLCSGIQTHDFLNTTIVYRMESKTRSRFNQVNLFQAFRNSPYKI